MKAVHPARRHRVVCPVAVLLALVVVTACSSASKNSHDSMPAMAGMDHGAMTAGEGLAETEHGYTLRVDAPSAADQQASKLASRIELADGKVLTAYQPDQTKLMHLYVIRSDLGGFQHVHPTMGDDGAWTADLAPLGPGSWRVYASFVPDAGPRKGTPLVLSRELAIPGTGPLVDLPPASSSTVVDGYELTLQGKLAAGKPGTLMISFAKDGKPVTDLEPYLDTDAHLTAFHSPDGAFAHLHPTGSVGRTSAGPELTFGADLTTSGLWRLFIQFQTGGVLHTAAVTIEVS